MNKFLEATIDDVKNLMVSKKTNKYILFCAGKTGSTHAKKYLDHYNIHFNLDDQSDGTTVQRDVYSTQIKEWNGPTQRPITKEEESTAITIGLIRNPFEWLLSNFIYNNTPGLAFPAYPNLQCYGNINFEQFIKKWYHEGFGEYYTFAKTDVPPGKGDWHRQRTLMHYQVFDQEGYVYPDFLIRTEYLNEGLSILLQAAGAPGIATGKSNVSRGTNQSTKNKYSKEMIEMVEKVHARELDILGYSFDGPKDNFYLINPNKSKIQNFKPVFKGKL